MRDEERECTDRYYIVYLHLEKPHEWVPLAISHGDHITLSMVTSYSSMRYVTGCFCYYPITVQMWLLYTFHMSHSILLWPLKSLRVYTCGISACFFQLDITEIDELIEFYLVTWAAIQGAYYYMAISYIYFLNYWENINIMHIPHSLFSLTASIYINPNMLCSSILEVLLMTRPGY